MLKRFSPATCAIISCTIIFIASCTKLDTTNLGADIIPPVDNINTFADTFNITSTQGFFDDTIKITRDEDHVLGRINNDPLFGTTQANIYLQLKPSFYPYYYGNAGDTVKGYSNVGVDSVVLCFAYKGSWGDTNEIQRLEVREILDNSFNDSFYLAHSIKYKPSNLGATLGTKDVFIPSLKQQVKFANDKDSSTYQIRIKLSSTYANRLFGYDSLPNSINNAYFNDSIYRTFNKGLAVTAIGGLGQGNSLMYISLTDAKTRLEVHYRRRLKATGAVDTTYTNLSLVSAQFGANPPSASANYIARNYSGAPIQNAGAGAHYLQTTPGTYVNMKIASLAILSGRIIHRAQISIEQIPDNVYYDSAFSVPPYLYVDLIDTTATPQWKPIYYDLSPYAGYNPDDKTGFYYFPAGGVDHTYFGDFARTKTNALGQVVKYYDLNITRYVQRMIITNGTNYNMRLFAPYKFIYPQFKTPEFAAVYTLYNNPLAYGRIKIKSGDYPDSRVKLRVVVISSKS
ncbi:MAG: DUF4270 family protein [Ferruginibacter sp.]